MGAIASQIISRTIVYSTLYSGADQRKHQSSASLAFVRGIPRWHKWPVTQKMFPFDDVIMDNNGKGSHFRLDDDNKMSYKYIHSMGQLYTLNPIT